MSVSSIPLYLRDARASCFLKIQGCGADKELVSQLDDRLKREGVKTHKQRVEELNRYLSGLSEHHDMPRIGPG